MCGVAQTFVLPSLFLAMTYADSHVSKAGMEQLTALILMHGGNASILSQQPVRLAPSHLTT